ncbi:hypothetical protein [Kineococcus sp. SYSU DK002]|uniref:hypothetical protein n=1 Tax=Kineococcus sp. SYSU DK002 TaxID=3383123 RepID=UPI003D7E7F39
MSCTDSDGIDAPLGATSKTCCMCFNTASDLTVIPQAARSWTPRSTPPQVLVIFD